MTCCCKGEYPTLKNHTPEKCWSELCVCSRPLIESNMTPAYCLKCGLSIADTHKTPEGAEAVGARIHSAERSTPERNAHEVIIAPWEEEFDAAFFAGEIHKEIKDFIRTLIKTEREKAFHAGVESCESIHPEFNKVKDEWVKEGAAEERQFILNVLDGIDIADKEMGNTHGGTKAIRLALQSRYIGPHIWSGTK